MYGRLTLRLFEPVNSMSSPHDESPTLFSYINIDEEVNNGSNTSIHVEEGTFPITLVAETEFYLTSNPSAVRSKAKAPTAQSDTSDTEAAMITN